MAATKQLTLVNAATVTTTAQSTAQAPGPKLNKWAAYLSVGTITGTSPTLDVLVQQSADGANWSTLATFTQLTGASGSTAQTIFASAATDYLKPLLPYVRASYTIGGSATPTFNSLTVKLLLDE